MKMTRTEELTLSLAHGAAGKLGDGQILSLLVVAVVAGAGLRAEVDLGLVVAGACLLGVLSVLERRQFHTIIQKLGHAADGLSDPTVKRRHTTQA